MVASRDFVKSKFYETDTNRIAVIDAGTGLRNLGRDLRAIGHKQEQIVIAFTHFHWDHIQGFPFFAPAYDPGQKITLLTLGRDQTVSDLREIFESSPLESPHSTRAQGWQHIDGQDGTAMKSANLL